MSNTQKNAWATLFLLQTRANDVLAGDNWRNDPKTYDYRAAVMDEVVEARLAAGYAPFWSGGPKGKADLDNLKLELVDILHFLMSEVLQYSTPGAIETALAEAGTSFERGFVRGAEAPWNPSHLYFMLGQLFLKDGTLAAPYWAGAAIHHFGAACGSVGLSFNELYGKYVAKNALNVFRKEIGYKQDKSVKYWVNPVRIKYIGLVKDEEAAASSLREEGDWVNLEGGGSMTYHQGEILPSTAEQIEDNFFVMKMIDEMAAAGEDLLSVTFDEMVAKIRDKHAEITKKDQFHGIME